MTHRPLVRINVNANSELFVFVTVFFCLCVFVTMIWCLVHFQHHTPDTRSWQQRHMDSAYQDCEMETSDPQKIEQCYITVYGHPPTGALTP